MEVIDRRALPRDLRLFNWAAPDGWLHRRMEWPQPAGDPVRGSLLFAGGRGDFVEKYLEAMTEWHRRGWGITSFDWRGQGKSKSGIVDGHLDSFDILATDFAALVAEWQAATPAPHVIVGHSMGGHMLLRLLIEQHPAIAAAVLVAPMIAVNSGRVPPWAARLIASAATKLGFGRKPMWKVPLARAPAGSVRQQVLTTCLDRYDDEHFWWQQDGDFAPAAPTFGWLRAGMKSGRLFSEARLGCIETPILLLGAEEDRLVSAKAIRNAAAALPRSELHMFAGCAHELLRESDETRLPALAAIDAFLAKHAP